MRGAHRCKLCHRDAVFQEANVPFCLVIANSGPIGRLLVRCTNADIKCAVIQL
jgi:hypothetical protein